MCIGVALINRSNNLMGILWLGSLFASLAYFIICAFGGLSLFMYSSHEIAVHPLYSNANTIIYIFSSVFLVSNLLFIIRLDKRCVSTFRESYKYTALPLLSIFCLTVAIIKFLVEFSRVF